MATPPRTIYDPDFTLEASTTYAKLQQELEEIPTPEGRRISRQTQVLVTTPLAESEFDAEFSLRDVNRSSALFSTPITEEANVFTTQVIPRLGTQDQQQSQLEKIRAVQSRFKQEKVTTWEEQSDIDEVEKEKIKLSNTFETVRIIDRNLDEIISATQGFHKA